ncbi:MAG: class I SAM-dependent methyltransferase [bacterium]|nr:class I SAM-dependent methyltransferase [bacterium]
MKCSQCGHIYPQPMPIPNDLNELYKDADDYFVHHAPGAKIQNYSSLLNRLEKRLGYKGKALDVGSGRGELLYAARCLGWDAQGVETSNDFAHFARSTYGVEVKNCSLESAQYPDGHFDLVTLGAVIEHLYHPKQIMLEVNRILK